MSSGAESPPANKIVPHSVKDSQREAISPATSSSGTNNAVGKEFVFVLESGNTGASFGSDNADKNGDMSNSSAFDDDEKARQNKKRKKYSKRACYSCRKAHSGCSDERPCERCLRKGIPCVETHEELVRIKQEKRRAVSSNQQLQQVPLAHSSSSSSSSSNLAQLLTSNSSSSPLFPSLSSDSDNSNINSSTTTTTTSVDAVNLSEKLGINTLETVNNIKDSSQILQQEVTPLQKSIADSTQLKHEISHLKEQTQQHEVLLVETIQQLQQQNKLLLRLLSQQQELAKNSLLSNPQLPYPFSNAALQIQDPSTTAPNNSSANNGATNAFYFHPSHRLEEGISIWNPVTLEIIGCNDQFQRMIGTPYSELTGRRLKFYELAPLDKQEALRENILQKISAGTPKMTEITIEMRKLNNEHKSVKVRIHFENGFLWCVHHYT